MKVPLYMRKLPSGTSLKLMIHWFQQMEVNEFRNFDYGSNLNLQMYNNTIPPRYDLEQIKVPVAVFYSDNDLLTVTQVKV